MKVFVLGHKGMLGHVVTAYFREAGVEVLSTDARFTGMPGDPLISDVRDSGASWVVNAIGKIKQKTTDGDKLIAANALLPVCLKSYLRADQRLIHASTDCVFSGTRGNYGDEAERDANDIYGFSKILGEVVAEQGKCQVIRVSIIGPELKAGAGLMGWFLSQNLGVKGYTNHLWNGITTLEWAKIALEIIRGEFVPSKAILHVGSAAPVSKYDLLKMIRDVWQHDIPIEPVEAPDKVDRTLVPVAVRAPIRAQLQEQFDWYQSLCRQ